MRRGFIVVVLGLGLGLGPGHAVAKPTRHTVACPDGADRCELEVVGKVISTRREAKWDDVTLETAPGRRLRVAINIPHRQRLGPFRAGTRYRFRVSANRPFGPHDLWIIGAKRVD